MKITRKITAWSLGLMAAVSIMSCSSDDNDDNSGNPDITQKPYVLSLAIQGSEGGFTYYTIPFENVMEGSLTAAEEGIDQPGYYDFTKVDNTLYSIGGLDNTDVSAISQNEDQTLSTEGNVSLSESIRDLVKADDETLISASIAEGAVTFRLFDANTVSITETIAKPTSDLHAATDANPSFSGMRVVGDHVFLSYYMSNPDTWATNYTDQAQVAVYSYPELDFEKVITDDRVGPLGGFNIKSGLEVDEDGNIYAISHSNPANGYSQSTKPAGILKINAGETEFDQSYFFDVEDATGGNNVSHLKYLGNGKAFVEVNTAARAEQGTWSDSPLRSAVVNLNDETVNYIAGVPVHNGNGRRLAALHDGNYVYLCIPEEGGIYVYRMDVNNYTSTKGAEVQANFVAGFFKF
ncbi:DUF4374 domain-containing protein [Pseudotamlana agarivorans]|uniref:DUF4374 domain-containing protein n=1 Tax=Pseudotamlana agarivorans TaxID=481183 RepID=UPI000830B3B4|nr:DUF4374 domain-containing protein [Tamlana agarivorans]